MWPGRLTNIARQCCQAFWRISETKAFFAFSVAHDPKRTTQAKKGPDCSLGTHNSIAHWSTDSIHCVYKQKTFAFGILTKPGSGPESTTKEKTVFICKLLTIETAYTNKTSCTCLYDVEIRAISQTVKIRGSPGDVSRINSGSGKR